MTDWREYFRANGDWAERVYQNFFARRESEAKSKLTKIFGPLGCRCPMWASQCIHYGKDEVCTHPSNKPDKPPKPECEHGHQVKRALAYVFERYTDKHCRDCGDKL
ncbi:hypothetical protein LCGC14_2303060 [marine sediment metagenome]|uniref:Uncharacterized protein n=1 Tax=marine sediment metagenome TaxID=412755 RepID=A0A0F9DAC3_9ZZZZ